MKSTIEQIQIIPLEEILRIRLLIVQIENSIYHGKPIAEDVNQLVEIYNSRQEYNWGTPQDTNHSSLSRSKVIDFFRGFISFYLMQKRIEQPMPNNPDLGKRNEFIYK